MKNKRLYIGIIICVLLCGLLIKWRMCVVVKKRNAPIVSFVKEWVKSGKPVVVKEVKRTDVPTYTKVTSWKVSPKVYEGHVSKTVRDQLQTGQEMIFKVGDYSYQGKIIKVSEDLSFDTGMYPVFVEVPEEIDTVGWVVALAHTGTIKNALNIDDEIAELKDGNYYVWTVKDGKAKRNMVTITSRNSYGLIIESGLKEGDLVVVEGHTKLREGDKINLLDTNKGGPVS